jgi:hypothetical protein
MLATGTRAASTAPARSSSWLRDWPMLAGLVVAAAMIAASTTVAAATSVQPTVAKAERSPFGVAAAAQPAPTSVVNVSGRTAAFRDGELSYRFSAPTHAPRVGTPWVVSLSAARGGAPLAGKVSIDVMYGGAVVGHAGGGSLRRGRYSYRFDWPPAAAGHPLVVRAAVTAGGGDQTFLFPVAVGAGG